MKFLNPEWFYLACLIICGAISLAIGSSWTTAGTIGVALIAISEVLGLNPAITAGAVISGGYFGDKMSPLSDTTNLSPAIAGTVIVSSLVSGNAGYALALIVLGVFGLVGLGAAILLPKNVGSAQPEPNASNA